jgi:adenosine deaminase
VPLANDEREADSAVRAEIFFDPQAHMQRGVAIETVLAGLSRAVRRSEAELGLSAALLVSFLRDRPVAEAHATLDAALPFQDAFIGVCLDSAEAGHAPEAFAEVFARCREAGLHVAAHAGDEWPSASIEAALDLLGMAAAPLEPAR